MADSKKIGVRRLARREWGEVWLQLKCIRNFFGKQKPRVLVWVSLECCIRCKPECPDLGVNSFYLL